MLAVAVWTLAATVLALTFAIFTRWVDRRRLGIYASAWTHYHPDELGGTVRRVELTVTASTGNQPLTIESIGAARAERKLRRTSVGLMRPPNPDAIQHTPQSLAAAPPAAPFTGFQPGKPPYWPGKPVRLEAGSVVTWTLGEVQIPAEVFPADGQVELRVIATLPRIRSGPIPRGFWRLAKRLRQRRAPRFIIDAVSTTSIPARPVAVRLDQSRAE